MIQQLLHLRNRHLMHQSAAAPWPVPTTSTFAPANGFPLLSVMVPEMDCAKSGRDNEMNNKTPVSFFIRTSLFACFN